MDIKSGTTGKGLSAGEYLRATLPGIVGRAKSRADFWEQAEVKLNDIWYLEPKLPSISRILYLRYHEIPINDLSLCVIREMPPPEWLKIYRRDELIRHNFQTDADEPVEDICWDSPEGQKWHERMADLADLGLALLQGLIFTDQAMSELIDGRAKARSAEDKKSHDKWTKEHPWQGLGNGLQLTLLRALYGESAINEPYNRALCLLWWAGEVTS